MDHLAWWLAIFKNLARSVVCSPYSRSLWLRAKHGLCINGSIVWQNFGGSFEGAIELFPHLAQSIIALKLFRLSRPELRTFQKHMFLGARQVSRLSSDQVFKPQAVPQHNHVANPSSVTSFLSCLSEWHVRGNRSLARRSAAQHCAAHRVVKRVQSSCILASALRFTANHQTEVGELAAAEASLQRAQQALAGASDVAAATLKVGNRTADALTVDPLYGSIKQAVKLQSCL